MGSFLRAQSTITILVISSLALSRVLQLLTFFLPLKVILLAASDGVPRYFAGFIDPEQKVAWITALAIAAVITYLLYLFSDAVADKYARLGSGKVLQNANQISLMRSQQAFAQRNYVKVCESYASLAFCVLAVAIGFYLNFWLFVFISAVLLVEFAVFSFLSEKLNLVDEDTLPEDQAGAGGGYSFIQALGSVNFLLAFGFILADIIFRGYDNILLAILSILLVRQLFNNLAAVVRDAIRFTRNKARINALVFRHHQFTDEERSDNRILRRLFAKPLRLDRTRRLLKNNNSISFDDLNSSWIDTRQNGIAVFAIDLQDESGTISERLLEKVYPPRQVDKLETEAFLFRYIATEQLHAPKWLLDHEVEGFDCRIYVTGRLRELEGAEWKAARDRLLFDLWSLQPPSHLIEAYTASRPLLYSRFNRMLIERLDIAVDTEAERNNYQSLLLMLDELQALLEYLPLFIFNPGINRNNVFMNESGNIVVTEWGRWSLEPVGVGLELDEDMTEHAKETFQRMKVRNDIPGDMTWRHLVLAAQCYELERKILNEQYKSALMLSKECLESHYALVDELKSYS